MTRTTITYEDSSQTEIHRHHFLHFHHLHQAVINTSHKQLHSLLHTVHETIQNIFPTRRYRTV